MFGGGFHAKAAHQPRSNRVAEVKTSCLQRFALNPLTGKRREVMTNKVVDVPSIRGVPRVAVEAYMHLTDLSSSSDAQHFSINRTVKY